MRRTLMPILLALLAALFVFALMGCGGDESSADDQPTVTETVVVDDTTTDTNPGDDLDEDPGEETTTAADDDEVDLSDVATGENCRELANVATNLVKALGGQPGQDLEKTAQFLEEFADRTPEEIREDFRVVTDAYSKFVEALKDVDLTSGQPPDPEALQRLQEVSQDIDQARLQQANENISRWVQENCR